MATDSPGIGRKERPDDAKARDVHESVPASEPWQLTLGRYAIQQLPTIITAAALAIGGCYGAREIHQKQIQVEQKIDAHGELQQDIKASVDKTAADVKQIKKDGEP